MSEVTEAKPRIIPNVWGGKLDAVQSLGPRLRAVTWSVQGRSSAPDNLFDWLLADNRYPQHRGRSAAFHFISEQAKEIAEAARPTPDLGKDQESAEVAFLRELDQVAPNIRASHNNTVFTRDEIMRAFKRYQARAALKDKE